MCGHGIIALVTTLPETGAIAAQSRQTAVNIDTPAGLARATPRLDSSGYVERISFLNVLLFLYARDVKLMSPAFGHLTIDIAFDGVFYNEFIIDSQDKLGRGFLV